jgi:hypothetical protein
MFEEKDFKRCFYNPMVKNLFGTYPRLSDLIPKEIDEDDPLAAEKDRLVRYILALYDPQSPIIKEYPDLTSRKRAAAEIAGYNAEKERELLDIVFACDSEYMVNVIVAFLKNIVQSRLWASIQADEQTFWEFVGRMMLPIAKDNKDKDMVSAVAMKTKLSEDKESISTQLEKNLQRFFSDDDNLKKKVEKKNNWSPESMAGVK